MITWPAAGVLAEYGQTAAGDAATALAQVDAAADAGCWGVKFQAITPDLIAAPSALPYWHTRRPQDTQAATFAVGAVDPDWWAPIRARAAARGLAFVITPFDLECLDWIEALEPDAVKIASGDITWDQLIVGCARRFPQLIISTGASTLDEVRQALRWARVYGDPEIMLLACSLEYPTPAASAELGRVAQLAHHGAAVGYSDHTVQVSAPEAYAHGMAVAAAGAALLEKHAVGDYVHEDAAQIPDIDMAAGPSTLRALVHGMAHGLDLRGSGELTPHSGEISARVGARRTLTLVRDLKAGDIIRLEDLGALRPAGGCTPDRSFHIAGHKINRDTPAGFVVQWTGSGRPGEVHLETAPLDQDPAARRMDLVGGHQEPMF